MEEILNKYVHPCLSFKTIFNEEVYANIMKTQALTSPAEASTQDDLHFMSFASKSAKKGSLESKQATSAAINRPFLVLTYNYSNNLDVRSPDDLVKMGCLMARRTEGSETGQSKRGEKNKASGKVQDKKNEQKRGTAPTSAPKITLKATVDPGKGAANITQVSILVAAAALLSAALMAF